jgi:hypothetical protein
MSNIKKAHDMKYHYVYKTTNTSNGKYYIGLKSSDTLDDDYLGSGIAFKRAVKKYGKDKFKKEILSIFSTREEASEFERVTVNIDIVNDKLSYNLCLGGDRSGAGMRTVSLESRELNRKAHLGRTHNDVTKEACRQIMLEEHVKREELGVYKKIKETRSSEESRAKTSARSLEMWSNEDFKKSRIANMKKVAQSEDFKAKSSFNAHKRHHIMDGKVSNNCRWCNGEQKWW